MDPCRRATLFFASVITVNCSFLKGVAPCEIICPTWCEEILWRLAWTVKGGYWKSFWGESSAVFLLFSCSFFFFRFLTGAGWMYQYSQSIKTTLFFIWPASLFAILTARPCRACDVKFVCTSLFVSIFWFYFVRGLCIVATSLHWLQINMHHRFALCEAKQN